MKNKITISKKLVMSIYYKVSLFIAMGAFLSLFLYLSKFPETMNGDITKKLFTLNFNITLNVYEEVFNFAVIIFFGIFLFNVLMLVYSLMGKKLEGTMAEGVFYNTIATFLILVAHLAYLLQIPKTINGEISHSVFHSNFYELTTSRIIVFNFGYLFITIYLFYNVFVIYKLLQEEE